MSNEIDELSARKSGSCGSSKRAMRAPVYGWDPGARALRSGQPRVRRYRTSAEVGVVHHPDVEIPSREMAGRRWLVGCSAVRDCELVFNAMGLPEQWLDDPDAFDRLNAVVVAGLG